MKELEWNLSTLITGEEEFKTKIEKIKVHIFIYVYIKQLYKLKL